MLAGPPPGLGAGGPPSGLPVGGPPFAGRPAGLPAGLPPRGPAGAPPRDIAGSPRLDGGAGLRGLDRGGQANFGGVEERASAYSANSYAHHGYTGEGYSRGYGRGYRYLPYAAAAAYAYGSSDGSSDEGCYHVSTYRRYGIRRVLVCHGD